MFGTNIVFILAILAGFADSVPHEFCLEPFDDRDCKLAPVPVFYFYKPGSRCEIKMWRGCPTRNKFPDEVLCSHYCIGRLWGQTDEAYRNTAGKQFLAKHEPNIQIVDINTDTQLMAQLVSLDLPQIEDINNLLDLVMDVHQVRNLTNTEISTIPLYATNASRDEDDEPIAETVIEEVTTEKVTTEEVTTEEVTTEKVTSEEVTTEKVTTEEVTTENVTIEEVTTEGSTGETEAPTTTPTQNEEGEGSADEVITA